MTTAIRQYETAETGVRTHVDYTGMLSVATQLVNSGFLPEHIKTPGQAVAIIMAGEELGMRPMLALRSLSMVKGKIVVAADAQLALFKSRGGRAWFERLDEKSAILQLVHANGDKHTESFTIEDAKRAGLIGNGTWQKFPKAMLRSRCITAGLKSIGFEPTAGAYDPDEAQHFEGFKASTTAAGAQEPESETDTAHAAIMHDLAWARAYPLPFPKHKHHGEPIDTRDTKELQSFHGWCVDKIRDAGNEGRELAPTDMLVEFKEALDLILAERKEVAEKDQTKLDLAPAKKEIPQQIDPLTPPAAKSTSVPVPPPGKVADALTPTKPDPASRKSLYDRIRVALESPAIDTETRDLYKQDMVNAFKKPPAQPLEWWVKKLEELAGITENKNKQLDDLF